MDYSELFIKAILKIDEFDFNQRKIIVGCSTILPELPSAHAIKQYMENILFELEQTSHKSADDEKIRALNEYLGMPKLPFDV